MVYPDMKGFQSYRISAQPLSCYHMPIRSHKGLWNSWAKGLDQMSREVRWNPIQALKFWRSSSLLLPLGFQVEVCSAVFPVLECPNIHDIILFFMTLRLSVSAYGKMSQNCSCGALWPWHFYCFIWTKNKNDVFRQKEAVRVNWWQCLLS